MCLAGLETHVLSKAMGMGVDLNGIHFWINEEWGWVSCEGPDCCPQCWQVSASGLIQDLAVIDSTLPSS